MGVTKRGSHDPEAPAVSSVSVNHTHRFTVQEKSEFVTLTTATAQILGSLGPVWSRDGSSCHRIFSSGDLGLSRGLFYRPAPPAALLQGPRRTFLQRDKSGSAVERREHAAMHRWAGCWLTHKKKVVNNYWRIGSDQCLRSVNWSSFNYKHWKLSVFLSIRLSTYIRDIWSSQLGLRGHMGSRPLLGPPMCLCSATVVSAPLWKSPTVSPRCLLWCIQEWAGGRTADQKPCLTRWGRAPLPPTRSTCLQVQRQMHVWSKEQLKLICSN